MPRGLLGLGLLEVQAARLGVQLAEPRPVSVALLRGCGRCAGRSLDDLRRRGRGRGLRRSRRRSFRRGLWRNGRRGRGQADHFPSRRCPGRWRGRFHGRWCFHGWRRRLHGRRRSLHRRGRRLCRGRCRSRNWLRSWLWRGRRRCFSRRRRCRFGLRHGFRSTGVLRRVRWGHHRFSSAGLGQWRRRGLRRVRGHGRGCAGRGRCRSIGIIGEGRFGGLERRLLVEGVVVVDAAALRVPQLLPAPARLQRAGRALGGLRVRGTRFRRRCRL
mmetsp:Transcript_45829/g.141185  ORF Transcript_45829/g.141185 Transcript_45829/m.141185 type:complete len:271 (+) Transcript_45829:255-1067(+)